MSHIKVLHYRYDIKNMEEQLFLFVYILLDIMGSPTPSRKAEIEIHVKMFKPKSF